MMNARMIEDGDGVRAARAQKRRFWWTAGLSLLGAVGVGAIMTLGTVAPGRMAPAWSIAAVIAMAMVLSAALYCNNRATDEFDRMIMVRANSFGLYFYLFVQWAWLVLSGGGLIPPSDPMVIYMATALVTLGRYAQLKYAR